MQGEILQQLYASPASAAVCLQAAIKATLSPKAFSSFQTTMNLPVAVGQFTPWPCASQVVGTYVSAVHMLVPQIFTCLVTNVMKLVWP
jgi:hypothetical protein